MINGAFLMLYLFSSMGLSSKARAQESKTITVMSYNIHYGQGMDGRVDLPRIAKIISDQNPDLVGLQEIGDFAMAEKMGRLTGMKFVFGPSLGKKEGYGDAILSEHPFDSFKNYSIPSASSSRYQEMGIDVNLSQVFGRSAKLRFINTHFDWLRTIG
jgi:endonuclease/exonuclease/phosphatase family metal-dependent hydrolase